MEAPNTILKYLKNYSQYLNRFHRTHRSAHFEYLISLSFAHIMHLPFFQSDRDDASVNYRVVWFGNINSSPPECSPSGYDSIVYAHNHYILIEATMKEGKRQWSQEFARAINHRDNFVRNDREKQKKTWVVLATTKLNKDTYNSIKTKEKFIPLQIDSIQKMLKTSILAFSIKHLEVINLFNDISEILKNSNSMRNFLSRVDKCLDNWQEKVLNKEKRLFIGIKSYEALVKSSGNMMSASEILLKLKRNPIVRQYFNLIQESIDFDIMEKGLIEESLGCLTKNIYEKYYYPVPKEDFKGRAKRIIKAVEDANA